VLEDQSRTGPFSMPACVVCKVAGGRITRLEGHLDAAQASHLRTLTSGPTATFGVPMKFTP
jgi:hypothetical protein